MSSTAHPRSRRQPALRWLNLAILAAGLAVVVYGLGFLGRGPVTCRGVEMHPGDVCTKSSFTDLSTTQTQTYEQRRRAMRQSRPTVVGGGVLLAGFGGYLLWRSTRRPAVSEQEERLLATR